MTFEDPPKRARKRSDERRAEILRATLELLAELPVSELSTRRVARRVGFSQPALFKHFRSRESLLLGALALVRSDLQALVHDVLSRALPPRESLRALLVTFGDFVEARPGVPRLLFHQASQGHGPGPEDGGPFAAPLRHLASMQRALFAELVRGAQRAGALPSGLDPAAAAEQLLASIRGQILAWQFGETRRPPRALFGEALSTAWAAWEHGVPAAGPEPAEAPEGPLQPLLRLDVRPRIAEGEDPLEEILRILELLAPTGALQLVAPFRPVPLIALLGSRGHPVAVAERGPADWELTVRGSEAPPLRDLRGLPAPEPLEQVLLARAELPTGGVLLARLPRRPELLLQRLSELGDLWNVLVLDDGSCLLHLSPSAT